MNSQSSSAAASIGRGVGVTGPHREGAEELLADEGGAPDRVDRAEEATGRPLADQVLEHTLDLEADQEELGVERLGAGLVAGRLGGHGQAEEGRILVDALEQAPDHGPQPLGGVGPALPRPDRGVLELLVHALEAGPEQLVAAGEIDVDGGAGHARLGGDLVHGDLGGAPGPEEVARHVDDLVPPEVADDLAQMLG